MGLELRNVVKRVGAETHIHDANLMLAETGFNILLGPTLAGKSTLMQLMAGLDRPTSGAIWFGGRDVTSVPVRKRNVSMVYQQFINYPHFTVYENIASPLRAARMTRSALDDRVHRMADLLHLKPLLQRRPGELSGGQQQRVAVARAIAARPALVLADEPTANLDGENAEILMHTMRDLRERLGMTFIFSTHDPRVVAHAVRVVTLVDGRVARDQIAPGEAPHEILPGIGKAPAVAST